MGRLALGVGAVAFVAGVALNSIVGPNAASIDVRVQAALVGLTGVVIAATAGIAGAAYGARIGAEAAREVAASASREAQADRDQADRHRFTAERHRLYGILISAADAYYQAVLSQKLFLDEPEPHKRDRPTQTLDSDDLLRTVELLRLVAPPDVVRAARHLRVAAVVLSPYAVIPPVHGAYPNEWPTAQVAYQEAQREFVAAVREDLGVSPLPSLVGAEPSPLPAEAAARSNELSG